MPRPTRTKPARRSIAAQLLGALLAVAASTGCSRDDAPHEAPPATWEHLVELYEPSFDDAPREIGRGPGWVAALERIDGELVMAVRYGRDAWSAAPFPGVWTAPRVIPNSAIELDAKVALLADGARFERIGVWRKSLLADPPRDAFSFIDDELVLSVEPGERPPSEALLLLESPLGHPDGPRWRVESGRFAGDGVVVLPGAQERIEIGAVRDRALSFGIFATTEPSHAGELVFRVHQDGEELWSGTVTTSAVPPEGTLRLARVDLVDTDGPSELVLSVDGPFAFTGFASPVVGPRTRDDRPATALDGRPNLVLFVADTLRADAFASQRRLADAPPAEIRYEALEALAERSLVFDDAWSTSTWTLPSHASMFTSLLPPQHNAVRGLGALVPGARTLAEVLRHAGYRTVAVTDGTYVSSPFGLDQGFEVFDQVNAHERPPLDRARAILEHGDGRPTFLLVHTYYPHAPFVPTDAALARFGAERTGETYAALEARINTGPREGPEWDDAMARARERYFAQLFDFDAEFAAWMERFDALGWRDTSHLVFTSDHGEAFGDHGRVFHTGDLYESQWRVPLLWSGPGVEPGRRTDPASGIDLAPTLAARAGVEGPSLWRGRDLAAPPATDEPRRAVWGSVLLDQSLDSRQFGFTDGRRKILMFAGDERPWAFDLARDPDELDRLEPEHPDWPRAFAERFDAERPDAATALLPAFRAKAPSAGLVEQLQRMGYLGD